jgi:hypothetical protein
MGDPKSDAPWPSPRSWTKGSQNMIITAAIAKAEGRSVTETELQESLSEQVGPDAAEEYFSFLELISAMKTEEIEKVYNEPAKAPLPEQIQGGEARIDKAYAILTAIAYYKYNKPIKIKEFYNLIDYALRLKEGELAIYLVKLVMETHKEPPKGVANPMDYLHHKNPMVSGHDPAKTGTGKIEGLKKLQKKFPDFYEATKDDKGEVSPDQLKDKV